LALQKWRHSRKQWDSPPLLSKPSFAKPSDGCVRHFPCGSDRDVTGLTWGRISDNGRRPWSYVRFRPLCETSWLRLEQDDASMTKIGPGWLWLFLSAWKRSVNWSCCTFDAAPACSF
jgi:hypothetical protein